jgi:hypothetical protein
VRSFNLKNASPTFGQKDEADISKMYHNTAPPIVTCDDYYNQVVPISNFAEAGDRKDHASQMKMSSFHNSMAANH